MVLKIRPSFGLVLTKMELVILTQQIYSPKSDSLFIPLLAGYWLLTRLSTRTKVHNRTLRLYNGSHKT
jgi:hypothetical protein